MAIVPDDKDWTWVLDRRCPECGFDGARVDRDDVAALVRSNADDWATVLVEATDSGVRPTEDRWSTLEYACHVRDVHRLYLHRLDLMLDNDDPLYPNWDQDATAVEDAYGDQDPMTVRRELVEAATAIADALDEVEPDQWARTGRRSDGASFTIESFARYFVHDPIHHLWDVTDSEGPVP